MFKFVGSVIDKALGRKRPLDTTDNVDEKRTIVEKKPKLDEKIVHRIKVSNLPERDISLVKKYFKGLGFNRFSKGPMWSYALITLDVNIEIYKYRYILFLYISLLGN